MSTPRILFLDFDGVLHPLSEDQSVQNFVWLPVLEQLLVAHQDVQIIVHSTWRYIYQDDELRGLLAGLGARFAGSAPRGPREQAIQAVLQANRGHFSDYLVLDDAKREFTQGELNVLFLDSITGISDPLAQAAVTAWLVSTNGKS